jgi:hypothetical protein
MRFIKIEVSTMFLMRPAQVLLLAGAALFAAAGGNAQAHTPGAIKMPSCGLSATGKTIRLDQQTLAAIHLLDERRAQPVSAVAQEAPASERVLREIEAKGFSKVTGIMRRGENYVFQAYDPVGIKVRGVINASTGEIVGLSRVVPRRK